MGRAKLSWGLNHPVLFERVQPRGSRIVEKRNDPKNKSVEYVVEGEAVPDGCDEVELHIDTSSPALSSYVPVRKTVKEVSPHQAARTVLEQQIENLEQLAKEHDEMATEFERKAHMSRVSASTAKLDIQQLRETLTLLGP